MNRAHFDKADVEQSRPDNTAHQPGRPIVLLTNTDRWPGPARLAISLSKVGFDVSALCPVPGHPLSKTRCVRQVLPYDGFHPIQSLIAAIETSRPLIVVPCDDLGVQHLHDLYRHALENSLTNLVTLLERSLGPAASFPVVSARYDILRIAREEGILVPDTIVVGSIEELERRGQKGYPFMLKADGTWGGRGIRLAENARQAAESFLELSEPPGAGKVIKRVVLDQDRSWLRSWWKGKHPLITAQSHIVGRPANCAVVCWEGEVLAGIAVEVISTQEMTGPATVVRVVDSPDMLLAATRIARRLRLSGFFGLDFMINDESDAIYLIEMNPRCTPLCHLQLGEGRDLVSALWSRLSNRPCQSVQPVTENDKIAYYPQALQCQAALLQSSFLDIPQGEPELLNDLLHPWSGRSFLGRAWDKIRPRAFQKKPPQPCTFEAAMADQRVSSIGKV